MVVDVVIVGAGLSGIGAAYHLQEKCPQKSYVILEGRDSLGGTWDLFRYPGIRSDSSMHSLGYKFKPWREAKAIADGPSILNYVRETAVENGIEQHIRYRHRVRRAEWSSETATWTIQAEVGELAEPLTIECNFLQLCAGYYSYESGYTPDFKGRERFKGSIIHPQAWPEDLDYRDKQIVVIGSGATAVTLIPELAKEAAHVVMLQRSPTYMFPTPDKDRLANILRKILPEKVAYGMTRWRNVKLERYFYDQARKKPAKAKQRMIDMVRDFLPPDYDVETHFTPDYNPWDQRVCLVPNGDLFEAISAGSASVVTDHIETFTENGILLKSGQELAADIIITATGLNLEVMGGIEFAVDGEPVDFAQKITYRSMMFSDMPNLVLIFGYINASWTLGADLKSEYACRLINHMDETGTRQCTPRLRAEDKQMATQPWVTNFSSGYMQRKLHLMPKQGSHEPWINSQNYPRDKKRIGRAPMEDGVLIFS
ncbi:MAG: flavin-containing monooxygenase [Ardenticatenaceae bacterium]